MREKVIVKTYPEFMKIKMENTQKESYTTDFPNHVNLADLFYEVIPYLEETKNTSLTGICNIAAETLLMTTTLSSTAVYTESKTIRMSFIITMHKFYCYKWESYKEVESS